MKRITSDLLIVILCLSIMAYSINMFRLDLLQTMSARDAQPVGAIIIRENIVQRRVADRVLWDRLAVKSPVYRGDLIRAAERSSATIDISGQHIDVGENTLIRIQPVTDAAGVLHIELIAGSVAFSSLAFSSPAATESGGLQLNFKGRILAIAGGTTLTATVENDGLSVQVNTGTAAFIAEGERREIAAGTMVTLDGQGVERTPPAAVVTQPRPHARYIKSAPEPLPVAFAWNRVNLPPADPLRLEIAADHGFGSIAQTVEDRAAAAVIPLNAGHWHWRLSHHDTILATGRFVVVETSTLVPLSPAPGSLFRYQDEPPALRFQWSPIAEASSYVVEIASTPLFESPRVHRQITAPFFVDSSLGQGTWYWRVQPVFSAAYEGAAVFSPAASFFIAQADGGAPAITLPAPIAVAPRGDPGAAYEADPPLPLPAPGSRQPPDGHRVDIEQLRAQRSITFRWSPVPGANAYVFTLYAQTENGRRQINRVTVDEATWTLADISVLSRGAFIWQVEAVRRGADDAIEQRGSAAANTFIMDIPLPGPVRMENPGALYGH